MKNIGRSILITIVATALASIPGHTAGASADVSGSVRAIAELAAEIAVEEQNLLQIATATNLDAIDRAEIEAQVRTIDARGVELLGQLDRLNVDLTQAIRIALGELASVEERTLQPEVYVPAAAVYETAVNDLRRIAATPEAVTNAPTSSNSPAFGLLAVAALALLLLGAAALGNSLRRHPEADELDAMAWSDGLTGLANRRRLDADLARHDGSDRPTAAIMVEIDRFDEISDRFGRAVGDEILRKVGDMLASHVRYDDIVYRYGGEEFCILLPGASTIDAADVANRVVAAAQNVELPEGGNVTVSVGLAGAVKGDASGAVRRADRALYAAKEDRRDQAVANDEHPATV